MKVRTATLTALVVLAALAGPAQASHSDVAGQWRLDAGSGQLVRDSSGHDLDGRLGNSSGADEGDPEWISGRIGPGALNFSGGSRSVVVADSPLLEPARVTAEAWVRRAGSPGPFAYVLSKGASGCHAASYAIYSGFAGGLTFYVYDGSNYRLSSPDAGAEVWDGAWHHVAGTYDGSRVHLYVDGVEMGSGTPAPPIAYGLPSGEAFYIGNYRGSCDFPFTGAIDNVRIWSRALSGEEIVTLASSPTSSLPGDAPGGGDVPDTAPRPVEHLVTGVSCAHRVSFRRIARRGLRVSVTVARAGVRVRASMFYRGMRIGRSKPVLAVRRGTIAVRVKLGRSKVRPALRRHGRLRLTCHAGVATGGRSLKAKHKLILRP